MKMTWKKTMKIYSVSLVLMAILFGGISPGAMAADTFKIGLLNAESGPLEYTGRMWKAAIQFAVDEQNEKGGLFGKKIEILTEDHEWKADVANRKAKKLIMEDKVNILANTGSSAVHIAMNKLATDYKIINLNHAGTAIDVQGRAFSRYAFRPGHNSDNLFKGMALLMANKTFRKPYTISPDYVAGYSQVDSFKRGLKAFVPDATLVGEDYPPLGTKDFAPYITKIIAAKADAVILGLFGSDLISMIRQSRAMGLKAPFPFFTLQAEPYQMNDLKDDARGIHVVSSYELGVKTPENEAMIKKYHEKHKNDKDYVTWWPFGDNGMVIIGWRMTLAAYEKAGSLDPEKVIEAYEGFQYRTPVGLWTMRKCDHQAILPMFGGEIESGPNPYYNGSIRPDVKFPWWGPNIQVLPADKVAMPATPDYNPRCQ
jgi:branched-chain amino acid transport system substrate-binding protein